MSIQLRVVTPQRVVFEGQVSLVRAPGALGEFGVLPGHSRLLSLLEPGRLVVEGDEGEITWVVGTGLAEVHEDRVVLLVDFCKLLQDMDVDQARADLERARAEMESARPGSPEWERARQRAGIAAATLGN